MNLIFPKVAIGKYNNYSNLESMLNWLKISEQIKTNSSVFIKPNFTYPFYKPGVTTSPKLIEDVVIFLKRFTNNIFIGESNGGLNSWTAEESFTGHHLYELKRKYNINLINLSKLKEKEYSIYVNNKNVKVNLPEFLINEIEYFITMPVPKIHAMTFVTLAFKNQWGCLGNAMKRIQNHYQFDYKITAINKLLNPNLVIFDGSFFLNENGPMYGTPIEKNIIVASSNLSAASYVITNIMQVNWRRAKHFRMVNREFPFPKSVNDLNLNEEINHFINENFFLKRTIQNWVAFLAFKSKYITKFVYIWRWSSVPMHRMLYFLKGKPKDFKVGY